MSGDERPFLLGSMRVDPASDSIYIHGARKRVRRKLMEALVHLAAHGGSVVSRDELLDHLWPDRPASDESLTQIMSELRRLLAPGSRGEAMLETVSRKGYRLLAVVGPVEDDDPKARVEQAASDRRWGFALLLSFLIGVQALMFVMGIHHHH